MARPFKHPKPHGSYFRQRVPTALRRLLGNKLVSWSLRMKDPDQAKLLNSEATLKQAMVWERHQKLPEALPHCQIVALSRLRYRDVMASLKLEPGEPSLWQAVLALIDRVDQEPERGTVRRFGMIVPTRFPCTRRSPRRTSTDLPSCPCSTISGNRVGQPLQWFKADNLRQSIARGGQPVRGLRSKSLITRQP